MARKDVLAGITMPSPEKTDRDIASTSYAMKGASKSMLSSIGELASQAAMAERLMQGASIVELDTDLVDSSFVSDRLDGGDEAYFELREAIRERGQDTPVLVRPHPSTTGRYMLVFGHRRLRVTKELGRPIKAIIQNIDDEAHVIAQGQENSARDNLSFIEKAVFAQRLLDIGHSKETIQLALSTDNPMLTRMLSVTKRVPTEIIQSIGAAKGIGRDRWIDFASKLGNFQSGQTISELLSDPDFGGMDSNDKFERVYQAIKSLEQKPKITKTKLKSNVWTAADKSLNASVEAKRNAYTISFSESDAKLFGEWLTKQLDRLHDDFQKSIKTIGD